MNLRYVGQAGSPRISSLEAFQLRYPDPEVIGENDVVDLGTEPCAWLESGG